MSARLKPWEERLYARIAHARWRVSGLLIAWSVSCLCLIGGVRGVVLAFLPHAVMCVGILRMKLDMRRMRRERARVARWN